ncbi:MAG: hypothetical protein J2P17_23020 [Mycobacterium sp.]|nr:hypothetical protein [Mycobacterium sp.]
MRRINGLLRRLEKDRAWRQIHHGTSTHALATLARIDDEIAAQQARYDHLAGVPKRGQQ